MNNLQMSRSRLANRSKSATDKGLFNTCSVLFQFSAVACSSDALARIATAFDFTIIINKIYNLPCFTTVAMI